MLCLPAAAQLQSAQNPSRSFGPDACGPADPSYIHIANETGGQPMFLQRSEATKSFHLMRETSRSNVETVFRATGKLLAGGRDFEIPVDSSTKRITFALSVDTKGAALTLIRPSGGAVEAGQDRVEDTSLNCGRIVTVEAPETGRWRAKISGSGTYWLSAQAQSEIYFVSVEFVAVGGRPGHEGHFRIAGQPLADHPATLQVKLSARAVRSAEFHLVTEDGEILQKLPMKKESGDVDDSEYVGTFDLPRLAFRVSATGFDRQGSPFERQYHTLFHAASVEVKPASQFEDLPAGKTTSIAFQVRNVGESNTFRAIVTDSHKFVQQVEPQQIELAAGKSGTVAVEMAVPSETPPGTGGDLTIVLKGTSGPEAQNSAVVHFSVTSAGTR
jgi:hypothetical protein